MQVLVCFMVMFVDIWVPNWAEVVVISKWLVLYYAVLQFLCFILLLKHGDVEINPGPKKKEPIVFSCFHWNVNNILAHNKLPSLEAYNAIHQYDMYIWNKFRLFLFQLMTLLFPSKIITLFGQTILAILKGVVFACIIEKIRFWE